MKIRSINTCLLIVICSFQLFGQFNHHVENSNNLRKENCKSEPTKITETRIQKDKLGVEYEAWIHETIFIKNLVSKYSQNSTNRIYFENYNWKLNETGFELIRYDSTFYEDTTNLYPFGNEVSNRLNHQDTFTLLFNLNGNLIKRIGSGKFGGNVYDYDKHNNLILLKAFNYKGSVVSSKEWKHIYDSESRLTESKIYIQHGLVDSFRIFYSDTIIKKYRISYFDEKPTSSKKTYCYYDSEGRLVKKFVESARAKLEKKAKMEFLYDDQNNVVLESGSTFIMDELWFSATRYEYQYDINGNWLERTTYLKQNDEQEFKWFNKDIRIIEYD